MPSVPPGLLAKAPPWEFDPHAFAERGWAPHDDLNLTEYLQLRGVPVKVQTTAQAVELVARERSFHPVLDYLESLEWDDRCRLDRLPAHRAQRAPQGYALDLEDE
jgi:hypothetical protein